MMDLNLYNTIKMYFIDRQACKELHSKYEQSFKQSLFGNTGTVIYPTNDFKTRDAAKDAFKKRPEHISLFIDEETVQFIGKYTAQLEDIIKETNKEEGRFLVLHRDIVQLVLNGNTSLCSIAKNLSQMKKEGETIIYSINPWESESVSKELARVYFNTIVAATPSRHAQSSYAEKTAEFISFMTQKVTQKGEMSTGSKELYANLKELIYILNKNDAAASVIRYENILEIAKFVTKDFSTNNYQTFMTNYLLPAARRSAKRTEEVYFKLAKEIKEDKSRFAQATFIELYQMAVDLLDDVKCGRKIR